MNYPYEPLHPSSQAYAEDCLGIKCFICDIPSKDPLGVHDQLLQSEKVVFTDRSDGSKWVNCDKCGKIYHLKCVTSETEQEVSKKVFVCTFNGCRSN